MRTWIKICGTTSLDDALASIDAGADALGFVFAPSPRRIAPEAAREIIAQLPQEIEKVGVFVDEDPAVIRATVTRAGLTAVQLHGNESPAFVQNLFPGPRFLRVSKAVIVKPGFDSQLSSFFRPGDLADAILLDSGAGSGRAFDWKAARAALNGSDAKIILAGGLNPGNVKAAILDVSPWGVDVVSGVEREPGRKDPGKLKAFVAAVREAERA